ncbi:hypothetical protein [Cellulomonas sp. KH9]|uniref:hypothetical protein n=1 Tax=Cellulomonas sp. KH9 TaxID=1855324 RepID=UPI0008E928E3|nr:hypothetical protein [Cellulomonas sp. KH9]SFJ66740.1 hypothetical protein SAMN05216467_0412 [Cellulomonas sp. KH9]
MPRSLRALAAALLAAFAVLLGAPAQAAPAPEPVPGPVVLVGVTGLRWDDLGSLTTPALWGLSHEGSIGLVATRSVHKRGCPVDGWLAVSAGNRAADLPSEDGTCRTLRDPGESGEVPGWDDYVAAARGESYGARPGMLGDLLTRTGTPATGIGAGAAVALATSDGVPAGTHQRLPAQPRALTQAVASAAADSQLVVVDAGVIRDPGYGTVPRTPSATPGTAPETDELPGLEQGEADLPGSGSITEPTRAQQAVDVDERVAAVLDGLADHDATVLLVSLADSGRAALQVAVAQGPRPVGDPYEASLLTSGSTRQPGVVQVTDVTPTLLSLLQLDDDAPALPGAQMVPTPGPATGSARVARLIDVQLEASAITKVSGLFSARLVMGQAVLFVAAAILLVLRVRTDRGPLRPALRVLLVGALALGSAPVASFLTGLVPWWRADRQGPAFWTVLLGWIAVITVTALVGPWRRHVLGPAGVVAAVTVVTLAVDAVTGSTLVVDSPMGAHRILAARFYGMSNQAFALITAGGVLVALVVADRLVRQGRRTAAVAAVVVIGVVLMVVDGAPAWGADFGGPPALILAFAMFAVAVSGRRVSWRLVLGVAAVGAVVVIGFAALDWMRPATERTHLGRFLDTVLDGGLWDVVWRKVSANLRVLGSWRYLVPAVGGVALTWLVLAGPRARRGGLLGAGSPLAGLQREVPLLRPAVAATGAALALGFLMNDSGIVVPATGIALAVPCLVAAAAQWRLDARPEDVDEVHGTRTVNDPGAAPAGTASA